MRFKVLPDGQVTNVQTYRSANNAEMDSSGISAVKTAAPFPKISISPYDKSGLFMEMTFDYNVFSKKDLPTLENRRLSSKAQHEVDNGDWQAAAQILNDGLVGDPNNKAFKERLSEIYSNEDNILLASDPLSTKAIELAKKAVTLNPNNIAAKKLIPASWSSLSPEGLAFTIMLPADTKHIIREYKINNYPAQEYTFQLKTRNGQLLYGRTIVCVNKMFGYTFTTIDKIPDKSKSVSDFFASVKIK